MTAPYVDLSTSLLLSSSPDINKMSIHPRQTGLSRAELLAKALRECTLAKCPIESSFYWYRLSLTANAVFMSLFTLSLFLYLLVAIVTSKRSKLVDHAFTFAMGFGCAIEILGYVGRLISWENQWNETGFLTQVVCLTIAPAFMAGGIYLCLRRIVRVFGVEGSRIKPEMYTRIFIPCDVLSLILQAIGGGYAAIRSQQHKNPTIGNQIMVAGLTVQAATLLGFTTVSIDFGMRTYRRYRRQGPSTLEQSPEMVELRNSRRFKGFLVALGLSTMLIFWRSVFRVVELSEGWQGDLIRNQELFVAFEGVLILVAVMVLNVFHPAFCFTDIFTRKMDSKGNLSSDEEMGRGRTGKPVRSAQWDKEVERKRMERLSREWAKELEVGYGDWRQVKSAEWKAARIRGEEWDKEVDGGYEYPRQVKSKSQLPISETGRTKADREGAMKVKSAKVDSEAERRKQERKSAEWVKEMEMGYRNPVKSTEVKREVQPPRTKVTSTEWDNLDELGVVDTKALNRFSLGEQRVRPKDAYYAKR